MCGVCYSKWIQRFFSGAAFICHFITFFCPAVDHTASLQWWLSGDRICSVLSIAVVPDNMHSYGHFLHCWFKFVLTFWFFCVFFWHYFSWCCEFGCPYQCSWLPRKTHLRLLTMCRVMFDTWNVNSTVFTCDFLLCKLLKFIFFQGTGRCHGERATFWRTEAWKGVSRIYDLHLGMY